MEAKVPETTFTALVSGRVQGVGYRYFVVHSAEHLSLRGTVRNLPDGSVEVKARGDRKPLEELLRRLWQGPAFSSVADVQVEWGSDVESGQGFQVIR